MATDTSINNAPVSGFKTYPEFSTLGLGDRVKYEALIRDLPPMSEYSFPTLMKWWNTLNSCAVSTLNGNLIISYWLPGSDEMSGISLVGKNNVDQTICELFDNLKTQSEKPRLVHVPEFVISHIQYPELYNFKPERNFDEYVVALDRYYPLKHTVSYRRHRIRKFLSRVDKESLAVKSADLDMPENKQLMLQCIEEWPRRKTVNDLVKHSDDALKIIINEAELIGTENVCLFVDGRIQAFMLYNLPSDKRYANFSHIFVNYEIPYTYDYAIYAFSEWLIDKGIRYVNIDADQGVPMLRMLKLALGPETYFRKYTIEPLHTERIAIKQGRTS